MVVHVRKLVTQFGSRMRATFPALTVFQTKTPKPTNAPNYQRFIAQL